MKICVIGAGAMGSVFGGLLARAGNEVVLVDIWREQVAAVNASGLRLSGVLGELRIPVRAQETPPAGMGADVAMIWTDANATRDAAKSAAAALAPDGFAITLQNGIGNVETLIEVLGARRVAGGSSMCSAAIYGPGHAGFTHKGVTSIGELAGGTSERVERLRSELERAGFEAQAHQDIMTRIWTKFALNCAINALCATTGLRLAELARLPATDRLQDRVMDEILAVTAAKGLKLEYPDFRATVKEHCWSKFSRPSMLQHIDAGKRTEIDALNARLVEEARALGVPTPYNDAVACLLKGVEHKRREAAGRTEADYEAREAAERGKPRPRKS